jgi:hypothetical protein
MNLAAARLTLTQRGAIGNTKQQCAALSTPIRLHASIGASASPLHDVDRVSPDIC